MTHRVAILGASLGGMVAASELRRQGCDVTVFEKGQTVAGLYSKAQTPFGMQELGMHVIYASQRHYEHLCDIFGVETFHVLRGPYVDMGASANFGGIYWGSHYPSLINHPLRDTVLAEILAEPSEDKPAFNAEEEAVRRFGPLAAREIVVPILRKLWGMEPNLLTPQALHCFFDLRRMVVAEKPEADRLKANQSWDDIIANPDQSNPKGQVFGGRMGLLFREGCNDLSKRTVEWADQIGLNLLFGIDVEVENGKLIVGGEPLEKDFDACLVAAPVHMLAGDHLNSLDKSELTIYYLRLEAPLGENFPCYYILAHDSTFQASRIVNYDSYRPEKHANSQTVVAVEAIHASGQAPRSEVISEEVMRLQPDALIVETFKMPRSLPVLKPSLANGRLLGKFENSVANTFGKPMFFTGMRTDTGIFFSHHTIGLAYDSALECISRLN